MEPRYGGGSIADVVGSVCDGLAVPGAWDLLDLGPGDRSVILLIDGLGHRQLADHADLAPFLTCQQRSVLTSVTPSTTPVALTSLGTGLPPGQHGLVGASFRLPETGRLLWPLSWKDDPPVAQVQPESTWWQRADRAGVAVTIVSPRAYRTGGLTRAALGGGAYQGADGPGERVADTAAAAGRGERALVYSYWEHLDRAAHMYGVDSPQYRAELVAADRHAEQVAAALPPGSRLLVTSDHGLVDCPDVVDLEQLPPLWQDVQAVAGEPRFRHIYPAPGSAAAVAQRWRETLGDAASVVVRDEAIADGWFGEVAADVRDRIGDVIAVARDSARFALPNQDAAASSLIGQHGAMSAAEMEVPLIVA